MKDEIRTRTQKAYDAEILDEKMKNSLIQCGRDEATANFIKKVGFTITFASYCVSMAEKDQPQLHPIILFFNYRILCQPRGQVRPPA